MQRKTNSQQLKRQTMQTDRALEFFTEKELTMQIGQDKNKWAPALLKELIDNGLDACEKAQKQPNIGIDVTDTYFSVSDNGPGLTKAVIEKSLDYTKRVSDNNYYISPTRGQLGNALKTIYAAPFVIDGSYGKVSIETKGNRYLIQVTLDRIAQKPEVTLYQEKSERTEGIKITVFYKDSACLLKTKSNDFYKGPLTAPQLLTAYAMFNPHASFTLGSKSFEASIPEWSKWNPSDPTSPHWYTHEQLRDLIAAYVANKKDKTIREFISEFRGLSGTQKQKMITEATSFHGRLSDFVVNKDIDESKVHTLLLTMQQETQPVKPQQLGTIGKEHIINSMAKYYGVKPDTVKYKKVLGFENNLPYVIELAFGIKTEEHESEGRTVVCGLNWTPTLDIPLPQLRWWLGNLRIDEHDPVCVVMHIARPKFNFVDRGKGSFHV